MRPTGNVILTLMNQHSITKESLCQILNLTPKTLENRLSLGNFKYLEQIHLIQLLGITQPQQVFLTESYS